MNTPEKKSQPNQQQPDQGRSAFSTGTTTQGGSDHGQGSSNLAGEDAYKQGSKANTGSNYTNEANKLGSTGGDKPESGTQQGGGAGGYDVSREQQEVNKEREDMNNERDPNQVDVERPKQAPEKTETPDTPPETGKH